MKIEIPKEWFEARFALEEKCESVEAGIPPWAVVPLGEYNVPLIGIPPSAVLETCDLCGCFCHLSEIEFNFAGNQWLCPRCRK